MEPAADKIMPEKYFGIAAVLHRFKSFEYIIVKAPADKINRQEHRWYEEQGLEAISNNNGFKATFKGVEPYEQQADEHGYCKWDMIAVKYKFLQYDDYQI